MEALTSVGLITPDEAEWWINRVGDAPEHQLPTGAVAIAEAFLSELLEELAYDAAGATPDTSATERRFDGAVEALADVGLAEAGVWDKRMRSRLGRQSAEDLQSELRALNAGGTEQELIAVLAGTGGTVAGMRVLYGLLFADGVSFTLGSGGRTSAGVPNGEIDLASAWDWGVRDDLDTVYRQAGRSGSDAEWHISFRATVPVNVGWVELTGPTGETIRMQR